jgi:hypothetical protein
MIYIDDSFVCGDDSWWYYWWYLIYLLYSEWRNTLSFLIKYLSHYEWLVKYPKSHFSFEEIHTKCKEHIKIVLNLKFNVNFFAISDRECIV